MTDESDNGEVTPSYIDLVCCGLGGMVLLLVVVLSSLAEEGKSGVAFAMISVTVVFPEDVPMTSEEVNLNGRPLLEVQGDSVRPMLRKWKYLPQQRTAGFQWVNGVGTSEIIAYHHRPPTKQDWTRLILIERKNDEPSFTLHWKVVSQSTIRPSRLRISVLTQEGPAGTPIDVPWPAEQSTFFLSGQGTSTQFQWK